MIHCIIFSILLAFSPSASTGAPGVNPDSYAVFGGRIAKVVEESGLIRFRFGFANRKYMNTGDGLEFFNEHSDRVRCRGTIVGRTADYVSVKVEEMRRCRALVNVTIGAYVVFYSKDMRDRIKLGAELVQILLKKKLAVSSIAGRMQRQLDVHIEKVNAVNERYDVLRKKLEQEWQEQLHTIEEDRLMLSRRHGDLEKRLDELDAKLEKYKIDEDNFSLDRWSLDPELYEKK